MKTLIVGNGEIGGSLYKLIKPHFLVWCEDTVDGLRIMEGCPEKVDVMHICIRYSDNFVDTCRNYIDKYEPSLINICTTVPCGTSEKVDSMACHSTTRGLHPDLTTGLTHIKKHIGGPSSHELSNYFEFIGIQCVTHSKARTTELLHILNNCHYGVNLMFADEASKLCRKYGVDFYDYMKYTETNNDGYIALGHKTKVRSILTPPGGRIGGHCVTMSAGLVDEQDGGLISRLAVYNDSKK